MFPVAVLITVLDNGNSSNGFKSGILSLNHCSDMQEIVDPVSNKIGTVDLFILTIISGHFTVVCVG